MNVIRDGAGRVADVVQLGLGAGVLRPLFRRLARHRPDWLARARHEPFAARGDAFVRTVGRLEKVVFVAKMLGTDGGYAACLRAKRPSSAEPRRDENAHSFDGSELLFTGDLLCPGRLDEGSLSPALRARIARAACLIMNVEGTVGTRRHAIAPFLSRRGLQQLLAYERDPEDAGWVSRLDVDDLAALLRGLAIPRVIASVANNHTLDDGLRGFDRTLALLRGLGVDVVGDARTDDGVRIVDVGPHRVGLVAITYGSNRACVRDDVQLRFDEVPYRLSQARMAAIVDRLRARGTTHAIALLHWGYEHEHEPAPEQRACAAVLFEAGFSAVIGHHPHILQRSDAHAGRWVSYSLGDFIGGDRTIWSRFGSIVALRLGPNGAVSGEVIPTAQSPFWKPHETMLLEEAPPFERRVFARFFGDETARSADTDLPSQDLVDRRACAATPARGMEAT